MGCLVADTPMRHGIGPKVQVGARYEVHLVVQHPRLWLLHPALVIESSCILHEHIAHTEPISLYLHNFQWVRENLHSILRFFPWEEPIGWHSQLGNHPQSHLRQFPRAEISDPSPGPSPCLERG